MKRAGALIRIAVATAALGSVLAFVTAAGAGADTSPAPPPSCSAPPTTSTSGTSFSATETLCRWFAVPNAVTDPTTGQTNILGPGLIEPPRTFSVTVSNVANLRDGQVVNVSWSGAHPTGAIISDQQSAWAAQQEYPVVLMECRGYDTPGAPLSPQTCWTATPEERTATAFADPLWTEDYLNPTYLGPDIGTPAARPFGCAGPQDQYWVHFLAADGTDYPVGPNDCSTSMPAEMTNVTPSDQDLTVVPSDTTYAETGKDGTGSANFTIATSETNASLGCSTTVPCSLVVIPINGISCSSNPPNQGTNGCEVTGSWPSGSWGDGTGNSVGNSGPKPDAAVTGSYWWSSSNWDRRISVPLGFAVSGTACSSSSLNPLEIYGSEMFLQASQQWNPQLCQGSDPVDTNLVQLAEPEAKYTLQAGSIEAALQAEPPQPAAGQQSFFTTPTVQAPIGVTGFAIAYDIDNGDGQPYTKLRLDARLLAKLMTESYPGTNNVQSGYMVPGSPDAGLRKNPLSIVTDPEFLALNPGYSEPTRPNTPQFAPAATLLSILSQSDTIWALTSYITADPEARAWLDGQPDPWGMVVNPAYKGIQLPVTEWPLLDTSTLGPDYQTGQGLSLCLLPTSSGAGKQAPLVPDRPLVDSPEATLSRVAYDLQNSISTAQTNCVSNNVGGTLEPMGPLQRGARFLIGLVSLPAANEYGLDTASLQTYAPPQSAGQFSAAGRVFVAPTATSLQAGADLFQPDTALGSWQLPYSQLSTNPTVENAYPGTMLLSLDVPTTGLPPADAAQYGQYLTFAASAGQTSGSGTGQLPNGYLPMTATNGLGNEVAYTQAAATDVADQNGSVPPLVPSKTGQPDTTTKKSATGAPAGAHPAAGVSSSSNPTGSEVPSAAATGAPVPGGKAGGPGAGPVGSSGRAVEAAAVAPAFGAGAGVGGLALVVAVLVAPVGGGILAFLRWRSRRRAVT